MCHMRVEKTVELNFSSILYYLVVVGAPFMTLQYLIVLTTNIQTKEATLETVYAPFTSPLKSVELFLTLDSRQRATVILHCTSREQLPNRDQSRQPGARGEFLGGFPPRQKQGGNLRGEI